MTVQKVIA